MGVPEKTVSHSLQALHFVMAVRPCLTRTGLSLGKFHSSVAHRIVKQTGPDIATRTFSIQVAAQESLAIWHWTEDRTALMPFYSWDPSAMPLMHHLHPCWRVR